MSKRVFICALLLLCIVVSMDSAFSQGCSQCRMLSEQGSGLDANSFGTGINSGILYLMAMPYILLMFLFRKQIKRLFIQLKARF